MLLKQVTDVRAASKSVDFIECYVRMDEKVKGVLRFFKENGFKQVPINYTRIHVDNHWKYRGTIRLLFDMLILEVNLPKS